MALRWLKVGPGITVTGKLREKVKKKTKKNEEEKQGIVSVEALDAVAGKPHALLSGERFSSVTARKATNGLVSHQLRARRLE